MKISVPLLKRSFDVPYHPLHPYTFAEQVKALPKLKGRSLLIDFQKDVDGPQTATRLIKETLSDNGVSWIDNVDEADAVIWIQSGSSAMKFAFVVAHSQQNRFIAAECGARELTATIMSAVCEYFNPTVLPASSDYSDVLAKANELNRTITGAALAQDWDKARQLMEKLRDPIRTLGEVGGTQSIKPIVDALADSTQAFENTHYPEAKALSEDSLEALRKIGTMAIPWIEKGTRDKRPAVRKVFNHALKICGGKPGWKFW